MRSLLIALFLVLRLPVCGQEEERKPSPFPDKNHQREVAAKKQSDSLRSKRTASTRPPTDGADRTNLTAGEGSSIGKACFFSLKDSGATTASGIIANPDEFVAASATYAFGSRVIVTNLANERSVEVRIIDRLSDSRRIISVSEAAARQLGFYDAGIANVKVEAVWAEGERH